MAKKVSNYLVLKITWFKTKIIEIDKKKIKVPVNWEKVMIGIYPSIDEAEFILRKAQKNDYHERQDKLKSLNLEDNQLPKSYFSIKETDSSVTTGNVANYLKYLAIINKSKMEANNG